MRRSASIVLALTLLVGVIASFPAKAGPAGRDAAPDSGEMAQPGNGPIDDSNAPLVADAGDSAYGPSGQLVSLLGTAFGGEGPYTFEWTTEAGTVKDPTNPTATIDTTDLAPGDYTATLVVTDSLGATATDTVLFAIADPIEESVIFEETKADPQPGVTGVGGAVEFVFEVPEGIANMTVDLTWTNPANDYDLRVLDPAGEEAGSSGNAPPEFESAPIAAPVPGEWTILADRFLTASDPGVTATVTASPLGQGDPRPLVDAGGPYRFVTGDEQVLEARMVGGTEPLTVGWDTDLDGVVDLTGIRATADLPPGRHLVTVRVVDADGFERREMTSVAVGTAEELRELTTPVTVVGMADSGINPYHLEFSAATYPDPEVLELTRNFTRHPSEYIEGYPEDAQALPITLGKGYFPEQDTHLWTGNDYVEAGQMYWIPGTKIVGAIDAGGSTGVTSGDDNHPILDDNGHGTGSASVSTGNRYGYCPTCLVVMVEALDETVVAKEPWIDMSSNSFGYIGGLPVGYVVPPNEITRAAAERGQTTLFAAGNGVGNAFDVPQITYGSDQTGPDWNITVGAVREDNQEPIFGDGIPVHVSNLGDGDLPSACRTGDTGQCAFGGTSAATPYTAGVFGTVLTRIRDEIGDTHTGQRPAQVVAEGTPVPGSPWLEDGQLTRAELRAAVTKTSVPRFEGRSTSRYPYPVTYDGEQSSFAIEGYGVPGPASAERAVEVLLGIREMPARDEDSWFQEDCANRDSQYGPYDRDGDGEADGCDKAESAEPYRGEGEATNDDPHSDDWDAARGEIPQAPVLTEPLIYFLHRVPDYEPTVEDANECSEDFNEQYMDRRDTEGDVVDCYDSRVTSTAGAFRPKGIFAAKDVVTGALPTGSVVDVVAYMKTQEPTTTELVAVLKANDREIGRSEPQTAPTNPATYAKFEISFVTERPVAPGEQLSFHFVHAGNEAWSYGYEGEEASYLHITPAPAPEDGLEFGATLDSPAGATTPEAGVFQATGKVAFPDIGEDPQTAGFHPVIERVQVSVGDQTFTRPTYAELDPQTGTWTATLVSTTAGEPIYVRALRDRRPSTLPSEELREACPAGVVPDPGFEDTEGNVHRLNIDCIAWYTITVGKGDTDGDGAPEYDPRSAITRDQMASFIARLALEGGIELPAEPADAFGDDDGNVHEYNINALAALGLVEGTGERTYDPAGTVSRAQMASFIARLHREATGSLPEDPPNAFTDDDDFAPHTANIDALAALGVVEGVGGGLYAPRVKVSRAQMASFIARDLDLLVAAGHAFQGGADVTFDSTTVAAGEDLTGQVLTNKGLREATASDCGFTDEPLQVGEDGTFTLPIPEDQGAGPCSLKVTLTTSRPGGQDEVRDQTVTHATILNVTA